MKNYIIKLGASDPEMEAIENLLASCGIQHGVLMENIILQYAMKDGARVHPGNAYKADKLSPYLFYMESNKDTTVILVECGCEEPYYDQIIIDPHISDFGIWGIV